MANCYGSKEYIGWVKEYARGFTFSDETSGTIAYGNYILTYRSYIAEMITDGVINRRKKTRLSILRNHSELYSCDCIDVFMTPYFFNRNGITYLFFKKSLYGYTLLNLSDISEINYFPSRVLQNEEAFIITQANYYRNVLFLCGCYWADADDVFILNLDSFNTYSIKSALNITEIGYESFVDNETVRFINEKANKKSEYTFDDCIKLIAEKEPTEI